MPMSESHVQGILRRAQAHAGPRRKSALPLIAEVVDRHRVAMKRSIMDMWCAEPMKRIEFEELGIEIPPFATQPNIPEYPLIVFYYYTLRKLKRRLNLTI